MGKKLVEILMRLESLHEAKEQRGNVRETRSLKAQSSLTKYILLYS